MEKASTSKSGVASSLLFSNEHSDSLHVETLKRAKQTFLESERRKYVSQIEDLQMSLEINKSIICDLLQCKSIT
jgi:SAM-dependent MidA family methyltransferase